MTSMDQLAVGLPDGATLPGGHGGGGSLQRMLVPVSAPGDSGAALAVAARACALSPGCCWAAWPIRSCAMPPVPFSSSVRGGDDRMGAISSEVASHVSR